MLTVSPCLTRADFVFYFLQKEFKVESLFGSLVGVSILLLWLSHGTDSSVLIVLSYPIIIFFVFLIIFALLLDITISFTKVLTHIHSDDKSETYGLRVAKKTLLLLATFVFWFVSSYFIMSKCLRPSDSATITLCKTEFVKFPMIVSRKFFSFVIGVDIENLASK